MLHAVDGRRLAEKRLRGEGVLVCLCKKGAGPRRARLRLSGVVTRAEMRLSEAACCPNVECYETAVAGTPETCHGCREDERIGD